MTEPTAMKCPQCLRPPAAWLEKPKYGSREIYWVGCRKDGTLEGGNTQIIAAMNWNRSVMRWRFDRSKVVEVLP